LIKKEIYRTKVAESLHSNFS